MRTVLLFAGMSAPYNVNMTSPTIWTRRLPWVLAFLWLSVLLLHSWYGPDIWYHLTWGREVAMKHILVPEQHTLLQQPVPSNPYWLFQIVGFWLYRIGDIYLLSLLFLSAWLIVVSLWLRLSELDQKQDSGPWILLGSLFCLELRFEQRPEVFSYMLLILYLWALRPFSERPISKARLLVIFLLQLAWTCTHGFFVLGPLISFALLLSTLIGANRRKDQVREAGLVTTVSLLGTLLTPSGPAVWRSVWAYSQVARSLRDLNAELFPPQLIAWPLPWPMPAFWLLWFLLAILAARALWKKQQDTVFAGLLGLGGVILSAQSVRHIPMLILLAAPLLKTANPIRLSSKLAWLNSAALSAVCLALILNTVNGNYFRFTGSLATFGVHLEWASYPIALVEELEVRGFKGKIFCDSYDGGYLEFHLPDVRVAGDSYFSDAELTRSYFGAIKDPAQLMAMDQRFHFDALLINVENLSVLDWALDHSDFALVKADSHRALFFRQPLQQKPSDLSRFSYYHGEDLRNFAYSFGVTAWMALASKRQNRALMLKILSDIREAQNIPPTVLKMASKFANDHSDPEMARAVEAIVCCKP